jgi:hypothetical protein
MPRPAAPPAPAAKPSPPATPPAKPAPARPVEARPSPQPTPPQPAARTPPAAAPAGPAAAGARPAPPPAPQKPPQAQSAPAPAPKPAVVPPARSQPPVPAARRERAAEPARSSQSDDSEAVDLSALSPEERKRLAGERMRALLDAKKRKAASTPAWKKIEHHDHAPRATDHQPHGGSAAGGAPARNSGPRGED